MKIRTMVAVILLGLVRFAAADSYRIFDLGDDNGHGIYGIDATGNVVVWGSEGCNGAGDSTICYVTFTNGIATNQSKVAPDLAYENVACTATPEHFFATQHFCNSLGDIVWVDPRAEETYEAIPLTSTSSLPFALAGPAPAPMPEPNSALLIGTGFILIASLGIRRYKFCP